MALARYADIASRLSILGVDKSMRDLTRFQTGLTTISAKAAMLAKPMLIAGGAIAVALGGATAVAARFEKQMAMVSTMLTDNVGPTMDKFSKGILEMSKDFGEGTATLSKGMYDILSASIAPEKAMAVLEVAAKAATAGITDTGVAADAVTTILNSYGLSAESAGEVSDKLFAIVKRGKTTFAELAPSIGRVAATASKTGLTFEELGANIATITRAGIRTEEAMTAINGVLRSFLKPQEDAVELAKQFGFELNTATLRTEGLVGVLGKLKDATVEQIAVIFPNIRGLKGIVSALGDATGYAKDYQLMLNSLGLTEEAFGKMSDTLTFKMNQLKMSFSALIVEIGTHLIPAAERLTGIVSGMVKKLGDLDDITKKNIATVSLWTATITLAGGAILGFIAIGSKLIMKITIAVTALKAFAATTAAITAPLWAVGAAMAYGVVQLGRMTIGATKLSLAYSEQRRALEDAKEVLAKFNKDSEEHLAIIKKVSKYTVEDIYGDPDKIRDVRRAISVLNVMAKSHDKDAADIAKRQRDRMRTLIAGYEEIKNKDTETAIVMIDNAKKVAEIKEKAAEQEKKAFDELYDYRRALGLADLDDAIRYMRIKLAEAKAGSEEEATFLRQLYDLRAEKIRTEAERKREITKKDLDDIKERTDAENLHYRQLWNYQEKVMVLERTLKEVSELAIKAKLEALAEEYEAELKIGGAEKKRAEEVRKRTEKIREREVVKALDILWGPRPEAPGAPARIERPPAKVEPTIPIQFDPTTTGRKLAEQTAPKLIETMKRVGRNYQVELEKEVDRLIPSVSAIRG